ncbi:MAG: TonB-dependent receptor, partial [Granulicella sp.]
AGANINPARPFPGLGSVGQLNYFGQSSYNSLQISVDHRPSHGLAFSANYTYAHTQGLGGGGVSGGGVGIINSPIVNYRISLSDAAIDVRHRVSFNGSYELPFGENRRFLNHGGALNLLVGGWNTSATFSAQTGVPFTVGITSGNGYTNASGSGGSAILIGDPFKAGGTPPAGHPAASCPTQVRTRKNWYNPCAFVNPSANGATISAQSAGAFQVNGIGPVFIAGPEALKYFGGRSNQIHGPGQQRANMSLFKNFTYRTTNSLQVRADVFNLFNTPSNNSPSNTGLTANGGQITGPRSFQKDTPDSRFIQLAMKLTF